MTTPLRQFILKRGNTAASSTYTGPLGEITFDTGLNALRIHDGITPGGNLMPSGTLITVFQSNIAALEANAATQGSQIQVLQNLASSSGPTPPANATPGALWYDSISGRLYVNYDGFWVDASPEHLNDLAIASSTQLGGIKVGGNLSIDGTGVLSTTAYVLPAATSNSLGGVQVGDNLAIDENGVLSALPPTNLGNLTVNDQTISGTNNNQDITFAPAGTGLVGLPGVRIPVGSIIQGSAPISVAIADLVLNQTVDYSTGAGDDLTVGDYGIPNGIPAPWAVYEFTTNPSPVLQVGDHLSGVGVPFLSNVVYVGTGPYANVVIADQTITSVPPVSGTIVHTSRDVVNAGLNITTQADTDITFSPGVGGQIITGTSILPFETDVYDLGSPSKRFRRLWLGAGTIYVLDETLGVDQAIGARDGNLYIAGGTGLTVGQFTLYGNTIAIKDPVQDIQFGAIGATGNVNFNRPIKIQDETGRTAFASERTGRTQFYPPSIPANDIGGVSIIGSASGAYQPVVNTGGMLHITGNDNAVSRITNDAFGTGVFPAYISRAGRGTAAAPSAIQSGDILSRYSTVGWGTTAFPTGPAATNIEVYAKENFTDTAQGTEYRIFTAPVGTFTKTLSATINSSGISFANSATQITDAAIGITFRDGTKQTTAWLGDASLSGVNANVAAANAEIIALTANSATQAVQINSIATNAVNVVTAGFGMSVSRNNGTVGVDALGVTTVAGTANQILVNGGTSGANAAITLSLPQSINTNSTVTFANLTVTGNITVQGNIISADSSTLDQKILYLANTATSQSQLDGGGIVLGNVNAAFKRSILYSYNGDYWDTDGSGLTTLTLNATNANFTGDVFSNGAAHFGGTHLVTNYDNAEIQVDSDRNTYSQIIHQNHNSGTNASTDFVAANDQGTDGVYYIDLGINSSTYNNPDYSIGGPNDGYLYNNGGNLTIGTQTAGNVIKFHTSGTTAANLRVTINDNGLAVVNNVTVGGTLIFSDGTTQTTSANTIAAIINANLGTATNNITTLFSNAATQATQINTINANVTAANSAISAMGSAWQSNAASQQLEINGLRSNITAANATISALQSNTASLANNINILFANAQSQEDAISGLRANITAANAATSSSFASTNANVAAANVSITTINSNVAAANAAITALQTAGYATVAQLTANVNAANSAIVTANTGMKSYVDAQIIASTGYGNTYVEAYFPISSYIQGMNANILYSNVALNAANVAYVTYVNTQISTVTNNWTANAAFQENEISALRANITAANATIVGSTYGNANVAVYLPFNPTIQAINANVAAANASIITYNNAMIANVNAANSAVVTANTGMKSYVDAQVTSVSLAWTANAAFQEDEISGLRANIIAANARIGSSTYSNVNVAAYLSTTTNVNIGNLRINDQTISGTIYGRDVSIFVNNNGAQAGGANVVFNTNLIPTLNYVYTLGNKQRRWAKSYHGPKSIDIDGILLETDTDVGGSNIYVGNAATFNAPSITSNSVMVATGNITGGNIVSTNSAFFYGKPVTGFDALYAGVQNGYTALPSDIAQFTGNGNTYAQINTQNISNGTASTADFVATSNDGTDTTYYVNMGIAGNLYANSAPNNSLGTSLWPRDSYLYAQGNTAANIGGNLVIGTTTPTKTVKIIAGGINSANIVGTFNNTGLTVAGNVTANYYLGDGSKLTNLPTGSSFGTSVLAGKLTVDPASVGKTGDAVQTFTLTGLTTNHKVLVTPGTALTYGIFITAAWASAADTLSVQFMNISGGSINLTSIDINYLAWV